jgi:molybdenum cofactor cytidylyltransferase
MGQAKLLLPWGDTSVLGHLIGQWQNLRADRIAVVCATGDQPLLYELDRLGFPPKNRIFNANPERGMFSSIQNAAQWRGWPQTLTHWAIALGDQPHLHFGSLQRLIEFAAARPRQICQPGRRGHGRHPVILPELAFSELGRCSAKTLKEFLAGLTEQVALCEVDDPAFDLDMDRPEDYRKALAMRVS